MRPLIKYVIKADGSKQPFNRNKVEQTCKNMGVKDKDAEEIATIIEKKIHDGTETNKILKMIRREIVERYPALKYKRDLRGALAYLRPKPDFERYIQKLLTEYNFKINPNQIIRGRCVENEIDAIAQKDDEIYLVEIKHHRNYHQRTGLDEARIAWAVMEDITEGYKLGVNNIKVDNTIIICNTKFSNHAKQYAECRGIKYMSWNSPQNQNLKKLIEKKELYPITYLETLRKEEIERITRTGIVFLKEITIWNIKRIQQKTGIREERLKEIQREAKAITNLTLKKN